MAHRIVPKTISKLIDLGGRPQDFILALGPHIQFQSFEVGMDVKKEILSSVSKFGAQHFQDISEQKSKVNLLAVLQSQLQEMQILPSQYWCSSDDTFRSPDYHSFRRDRDQAGRQYSFVAIPSL